MEHFKTKNVSGHCGTVKRSLYAIITARGGSKRIPKKNIKELNGKPLISYTIEAALGCSYIERCIVSTDDPEIKKISQNFDVDVIERPPHLAKDDTLSSEVVRHVLEGLQSEDNFPDDFILLQPTSPLRTTEHIVKAIEEFYTTGTGCLVSVTEAQHHPFKTFIKKNHNITPLIDYSALEQPKQLLPKAYQTNGAIYIMDSKIFLERMSFVLESFHPFEMDSFSSIDIDTNLDFEFATFILKNKLMNR